MAKVTFVSSTLIAVCLWASTAQAHDWAAEADHFHKANVERAFEVLEPLASNGTLRIKPSAIPGHANELAFGFALALAGWEGTGKSSRISTQQIAQAIQAIEVLAVLIDAAGGVPKGTTVRSLKEQTDRLGDKATSADYFKIAYQYRMLAVNATDRRAASTFQGRFMRLRRNVMKP